VNESRGAASAKARIVVLLLTAALAAVAASVAFSIAPAGASSGSGGVSTGGETTAQASVYERLWAQVSRRDRQWARSTAECESGGNPDAIGGGGKYRGAFQFLKSTWRRAPKSPGGDPVDYPYKTQAVVAIALKRKDGTGHWPNCG
jgi:soluble lytic murein transglycosylase-like protein